MDSATFKTYNYEAEYQSSRNQEERDRLLNKFIDDFLTSNGYRTDALGFRGALFNQLAFTGASALKPTNPWLAWIVAYGGVNKPEALRNISNDSYNNFISLLAQSTITTRDLKGNSGKKTETPLFVKDFFTKSQKDMTYIAKIFYWAEIEANLNKIFNAFEKLFAPEGVVNDEQLTNFAYYLGINPKNAMNEAAQVTKETFIYFILFKGGKFSNNGEFRETRNIYNAIEYLDDFTEDEVISSKDWHKIAVNKDKFKGPIELNKLGKKGLTELVAYLAQTYPDLKL